MILFLKHMHSYSAQRHIHAVGQGYPGKEVVQSRKALQVILSASNVTQRQAITMKTSMQFHDTLHGQNHIQHMAHSGNICQSTLYRLWNTFQVSKLRQVVPVLVGDISGLPSSAVPFRLCETAVSLAPHASKAS